MPFTQDNRSIAVITDAGYDTLLLDKFSGQEGISRPYRFALTMLSEIAANIPAKIKPHELVGTSMSVKVKLNHPGTGETFGERYFTGLCERFVASGADPQFAKYTAVIVPWFSFLNYASNCRIFQKKTVPEIVQEIVGIYGYDNADHISFELAHQYTPRDYCVQYRETDFAFISRLLESEGLFYYFAHDNGKHTMVVTDSPTKIKPLEKISKVRYSSLLGKDHVEDVVLSWRAEEKMHPGNWITRDNHHEAPTNPIEKAEPSTTAPAAAKKFTAYEYPGDDAKKFNVPDSFGGVTPEAEKSVKLRMQKHESFQKTFGGESFVRTLASGYKVTVDGVGDPADYLIVDVHHDASQRPAFYHGDDDGPGYENRFGAMPADVPYVPPMATDRTRIYGLQTARVIDESPSGNTEEIWPDKYGRVLVRFHWDRESKYAAWLRVVQPWAGKAWGQQWIPRVGDEVGVTFLEGDPDCPVIIGGVFNADNMPIFSLPDNKTQSGILTRSTKSGGPSNFNMLRFEDKIGNEEVHLQAEKDLNSLIKNDETRTVKANRTSTIHVNDSRTVATGQDAVTVQQGNRTVTVHQKITTVSETSDINTTANQHITTIAQNGHITVEACSGHVSVSSPQSITLTCGGSTITMTPGSISIKSGMVYINS